MYYVLVLLIVPAVLFSSCKEKDENVDFATLKTYLVDNNMDVDAMLDGWITAAAAVVDTNDFTIPGYYVIDLRAADAFNNDGHIKNAVNTTLGNILTTAEGAGALPILVVCYTGQTAAHAVIALRLSGYADAKVLKWGMAGWNADFAGKWAANSGAEHGIIGVDNANWTFPAAITANSEFDYPEFEVTADDGAGILEARIAEMLTNGFKGVASTDVLTTPTDYFVNNYWALADVEHYGHIAGAYRVNPLTLAGDEIKHLDPNGTVATYCWTGQTSSMITAYLNIIGYNAVSIKFGANSMIYTTLESHKYVTPTVQYEYVTE